MNDNNGPIFIGGLSASGKTQLRMVLGAHPELSMTRRTYLWQRYYGRFGALSEDDNLYRCIAAMAVDDDVARLEPDWKLLLRRYRQSSGGYAAIFALLHEQYAEHEGKRRWGEQLQFVECFADPIFAAIPNARMIHMVRHPAATIVDRKKLGWDVAMWLHSATIATENQARYPQHYRVIHYEAFATRPTETVREICEFIGETFTAKMATILASVRLDATDIDRGDRGVSSFVDLYAARALMRLGYGREASGASERLVRALPLWPVNRVSMAAWRVTRGRPLSKQAKR
jgi:hypothetical protein